MNVFKKIKIVSVVVAGVLCAFPATAQLFEAQKSAPAVRNRPAAAAMEKTPKKGVYSAIEQVRSERVVSEQVDSPFDVDKNKNASENRAQARKRLLEAQEEAKKSPVLRQMGHVAIETDSDDDDVELIFLYMKNFSIYLSPTGKTRCSMRFAIVTTLPDKLSALSCRLKWPKMQTTLNFIDVLPDIENHFDYTLLGDGCYDMAKQPNIIVNRCRAKGISQRSCAEKIRWITESK